LFSRLTLFPDTFKPKLRWYYHNSF